MLPTAAAMAVIAPLSSAVVRKAGTKLTTAAGLLLIAAGLWQVSHASVTWTFTSMLPGMILTGIGAALVIPAVSGSVMGSLPRGDTGIGSATNGVFIQVGGALGVAIIGSLLSTRYQDRMTTALAPYHLTHTIENTILGSIGGALGVADRVGGATGHLLAHVARSAFISGADLGLLIGAVVVLAGCVLALATLPARPPGDAGPATGGRPARAGSGLLRAALPEEAGARPERDDAHADGGHDLGYLLKDRVGRVEEFLDALDRVAAGGTALDPEVVTELFTRRGSRLDSLTPREREVLELMAEGRDNTAIAETLVITERAVSKHISNVFLKLGLPPGDSGGHRRVLAVLAYL